VDLAGVMRVLVVNAGSSTLKLRVVGPTTELEASLDLDPWAGDEAAAVEAIGEVLATVGSIDAVGHRVVHGGPALTAPTLVTAEVIDRIAALAPLAPLHQPRAVAGLRAAAARLPDVPGVACFDTAFHATLPAAARTYALPATWRARWGLQRFGFHGLSHAWASGRVADIVGERPHRRTVTCHLGAGASLCAVLDGRSVDTTMGFTPLEGIVMATRSGSVDPGLLLWLLTDAGLSPAEVTEGLEHGGGLAGLSGTNGDMRTVLDLVGAGDEAARLALDVYVHRARQGIAAMAAGLDGLDVLAFTGGVGEHAPLVRAEIAAGLGFLGVTIDAARNAAVSGDGEVSDPGARVATVVVSAREDLEIAAEVRALLGAGAQPFGGAAP
jgi:acetate kinase